MLSVLVLVMVTGSNSNSANSLPSWRNATCHWFASERRIIRFLHPVQQLERAIGIVQRQFDPGLADRDQRLDRRIAGQLGGLLERRAGGSQITLGYGAVRFAQAGENGIRTLGEFLAQGLRNALGVIVTLGVDGFDEGLELHGRLAARLRRAGLPLLVAENQQQTDSDTYQDGKCIGAQPLAHQFALFMLVENFKSHKLHRIRRRRTEGAGGPAGAARGALG